MARPDIAIGDHPDLGIVANTATGVPAAKILLSRLGFARDSGTGLYVMLPDEPGQSDTRAERAAIAVQVLRGANFQVDVDVAYEPQPQHVPTPAPGQHSAPPMAPKPRPIAPDVAIGRHVEHGITVAITGERPYVAMVLRAAGFTRDPERDVYTLPGKLSHRAASTIARNTALVLRQSGATVHILPGTLADPTPTGRRGARIARLLDGPHGARAMLQSLQRFVKTATAWCADRTATGAEFLADRFLGAAARLDVAARGLDRAGARLSPESGDPLGKDLAEPNTPDQGESAAVAGVFDQLSAELRAAPDGPAAAAVLARVTAKDGPLDHLQRILAAAAEQSTRLPSQTTAEIAEPLVTAVVQLSAVSDTLADLGNHLTTPAPTPAAPAPVRPDSATSKAAPTVAEAAKATPARRSPTSSTRPTSAARGPVPADTPAAARPAASTARRR